MPLGGSNIAWTEGTPAETDVADAGPIRSILTSVRNALGSEHNWPATGGPNTGYHLLGSARPFYDVQSNVSSTGTDGRLLVTSDTSRLFHVGSGGTMLLGSQTALSVGSSPTGGQRFYWAAEFGEGLTLGTVLTVTFPNSGFSGIPFVIASESRITDDALANSSIKVRTRTPTSFTVSAGASGTNFNWLSLGTRTL